MTTTTGAWWNQQKKAGTKDVVRHTPDPRKYFSTSVDNKHHGMMGGGHHGIIGAVIPKARNDGSSSGFDHSKPGVIIVAPPTDGGGEAYVIDYRNLTNKKIERAIARAGGKSQVGHGRESDNQTLAALQSLGKPVRDATERETSPEYLLDSITPTAQAEQEDAMPVHHADMPTGYTVPKSDSDGLQQQTAQPQRRAPRLATPVEELQATPITPMTKQAAEPVAQPEIPMSAPAAPATNDAGQLLLQLLTQAIANQQPPQPAPQRRRPAPPPPSALEIDEDEEIIHEDDLDTPPPAPRQPVQRQAAAPAPAFDPFKELEIPFLTGKPTKPMHRVVFEMGEAGTIAARFHAVSINANCVAIVYDTRYQDGEQWIPPQRGAENATIRLRITEGGNTKEIPVLSVGLQINVGCLDIIVLPVDKEAAPQPTASGPFVAPDQDGVVV